MEPEVAFGIVLRELRRERGLSQEALALEAGLQRNYVSLLERGQNSASIRTLFKLAPVLGLSVGELMTQVDAVATRSPRSRSTTRSGTNARGRSNSKA